MDVAKWTQRAEELFEPVVTGLMGAVPLAWVAFGVSTLGWHFLPVLIVPSFCSFTVGRTTALSKWMKEFDAKVSKIDTEARAEVCRICGDELLPDPMAICEDCDSKKPGDA